MRRAGAALKLGAAKPRRDVGRVPAGTRRASPAGLRRLRALLAAAAGGLYVGNWLSLVALVAAVAAGLAYRITVEERALSTDLGAAYREYAATHKRLVPFVW